MFIRYFRQSVVLDFENERAADNVLGSILTLRLDRDRFDFHINRPR
jgi:hypothetical protein